MILIGNVHKETTNGLPPSELVCDTCGETFTSKEGHLSAKQALQNHIRKFHEHRYQCNICQKDFAGKIPLKYHKKAIHEGIKECVCKYCNKAFARPSCLHGHIKQVHLKDSKDRKYCEFCAVSFLRAYDLKNHVATVHRGERPHKCEYCGKSFGSRVNLKNHTRSVHEGQRDYICELFMKEPNTMPWMKYK